MPVKMNLDLNYAREHWMNPDENPPIGLILCSEQNAAVAHYALGNLRNQVLAREFQLNPDSGTAGAQTRSAAKAIKPLNGQSKRLTRAGAPPRMDSDRLSQAPGPTNKL
jgi:hypothetical protein